MGGFELRNLSPLPFSITLAATLVSLPNVSEPVSDLLSLWI